MKIGFITISVNNLDESINFYQEILGLQEIKRFSPQEGINIAFLKDEDVGTIELVQYENGSDIIESVKSINVSIGVQVEDLDSTMWTLEEKGIEIIRGPIEVPGGERFIFVRDPNGVEIEFIQGFNM